MHPRISILIPAYNAAAFIERTLDSVITQRYNNLEVIVRDDGSTDNTSTILARWTRWAKVMKGPNLGPCIGRNELFHASTGGIVHFHDSDDVLHPDFAASIAEVFQSSPSSQIVLNSIQFLGGSKGQTTVHHSTEDVNSDSVAYALRIPIHLAAASYRRIVLSTQDPLFDNRFIRAEDWELNLRLAASGCAFTVVPTVLVSCYHRPDSFSRDGLLCSIALARMYCAFVRELAPRSGLIPHRWGKLIAERLSYLGASLYESGYVANAREAWLTLREVYPMFEFGNSFLDAIAKIVGLDYGFVVWYLKRDVGSGMRRAYQYLLRSRETPVRLG